MTPKVLFIGGAGRSGSTLLDRLVGEVDGFFSAGEISRLWRDALSNGGRCGCGEEIGACPTWGEILDRVHAGLGLDAGDACRLQERMVRPLTDPRRTLLSPRTFVEDLHTYRRLLELLYRTISETSGARVIVDSSKEARHGWLLTTLEQIDLRMVQLVRDSRAVAYSWQRRKFDPGRGDRMIRRGSIRTALEWDLVNELVLSIGRRHGSFSIVRYDDLV
ncbi:MAG: sulfotransferase, partial [Actinomycetota bacterium]